MNHLDRPSTPSVPSVSVQPVIVLACAVVGAYALLCLRDAVSPHRFRIAPDPDTRPLPAAPVSPLPPDAALVASNAR